MDLNLLETQTECDLETSISEEETIIPEGAWQVAAASANIKQTINPANYSFKFAPEVTPIQGTFDVACIALKWLDNVGTEERRVKNLGNAVANTYNKLSNGLIKLNVTAQKVPVNFKHTAKNLPQAEAAAKKFVNAAKTTKGNYDFYLIVNNGVKARSNAGGDTAHLLNTLILTGNHELGHLAPFKLEHAGVLAGGKVVSSKDSYSFMSNYGSGLTSPQLRNCGWLPKQVAQYEEGSPQIDIPMEYLNERATPGFVKAVRIPAAGGGKDLYLSIVQQKDKNIFALHQSYGTNNNDGSSKDGGGGSIRVGLFGTKFQFRNLVFTKVIEDGNKAVVRIATSTIATPTPTKVNKK